MKRMILFLALAFVTTWSGGWAAPSITNLAPRDSLDPLPAWKYSDMARAALTGLSADPDDVLDLRLLAWHGMIDDRPVHVEQALFWVSLRRPAVGEQWALVQLGRNPDRSDVLGNWALYIVMDTPWQPVKVFDHPPNNAEVYAFLQFWTFAPQAPWRLLTSGVRERTWKHATGESPTKLYPTKLSNNRLKLTARGRSVGAWRFRARAATYPGRWASMDPHSTCG